LRFLKPYRTHVWLIIALVLFQTLTELYLPALMASIVDQGVVTGDIGHIWRIGGMMMSVAAVGVAAAIWTTRISARTASAFGRDLRSSMFRRVTEFSMREFDELGTATLITRTTNDVTQVQQVLFMRSEEHTSELQSRENLVCRLLLEKKKNTMNNIRQYYHS